VPSGFLSVSVRLLASIASMMAVSVFIWGVTLVA
jgi:hypothetical protein